MSRYSVIKNFMEENDFKVNDVFVIEVPNFEGVVKSNFFFNNSYQLIVEDVCKVAEDYILKGIIFGEINFYKKIELTPLMEALNVKYGERFYLVDDNLKNEFIQNNQIYYFDSDGFLKERRGNVNSYEPSYETLKELIANKIKIEKLK